MCCSLLWCSLRCVHSSIAIILLKKRERGCFAFVVFQMSCYCNCFVALPHGTVGWSAVCDCGTF